MSLQPEPEENSPEKQKKKNEARVRITRPVTFDTCDFLAPETVTGRAGLLVSQLHVGVVVVVVVSVVRRCAVVVLPSTLLRCILIHGLFLFYDIDTETTEPSQC